MTLLVNEALFILTTSNVSARVDTNIDSVRVDRADQPGFAVCIFRALSCNYRSLRLASVSQISWVSCIAVSTNAGRSVVVRHAQGVGSALQLTASLHTLAHALAQLEAYLRALTVKVVAALALHLASSLEVAGVPCESWWTDTLAVDTACSGAALDSIAPVLAVTSLASVPVQIVSRFIDLYLYCKMLFKLELSTKFIITFVPRPLFKANLINKVV